MSKTRDDAHLDWASGLAAARAYRAEHGHLDVLPGHRVGDIALFSWLTRTRSEYRAGRLSPDRVEALDELGMEWSPRKAGWRQGLAAARAFHAEHGHLVVPEGYRVGGLDLGSWVMNRRSDYRAGRLPAERVRALADLGMSWSPREVAWERGLAAATAFFTREGHLRPGPGHRENGVELRSWLARRRRQRSMGRLSPSKAAALDAVGMVWHKDVPRARTTSAASKARWERNLAAARTFRLIHGHLKVRDDQQVDGVNLYQWLHRQRALYRSGGLPPEREQALDHLGIDWNPRPARDAWSRGLAAARAFFAREGHLHPEPAHREAGVVLSSWLKDRRRDRRAGRLTPDKIKVLDAAGMAWELNDE